ncbi:hypothetical protein P4123_25175 [Pseudomonas aeruginosa]|nr:hypothetical protein [Pseudomonas aeruginosa]
MMITPRSRGELAGDHDGTPRGWFEDGFRRLRWRYKSAVFASMMVIASFGSTIN